MACNETDLNRPDLVGWLCLILPWCNEGQDTIAGQPWSEDVQFWCDIKDIRDTNGNPQTPSVDLLDLLASTFEKHGQPSLALAATQEVPALVERDVQSGTLQWKAATQVLAESYQRKANYIGRLGQPNTQDPALRQEQSAAVATANFLLGLHTQLSD